MMNDEMKTKNYTRKSIVTTKAISFDTVGGKTRYDKGHELWSEKTLTHNAKHGWPVSDKGFVFDHFYGYGQNEVFPWDAIELKAETWDEVTTVENEKTETLSKEDFAFAKVTELN